MATEGLESLQVIDRDSRTICGTIELKNLLHGRSKSAARENERLRLFNHVPPERNWP